MLVLICAIFYSLLEDIAGAKADHAAAHPITKGE
jgi:hypothetical protein